ncbi:hypothetical protein BDR26DRAFT_808650, partial [Obelidium mucronatum]
NGSYLSTLYDWQWRQIHKYQQYYGVRMVALNDAPTAMAYTGKVTSFAGESSCNSQTSLNLRPAATQFTDPAGLKSTWSLPAGDYVPGGSCNFPASILDNAAATSVLNFDYSGSAAVVMQFEPNRWQMSFFLPCGSWSITCNTIGNIWFQWVTRGLYTGIRRVYFTPQIDDVFLTTDGLDENGIAVSYRNSPADIQGLIDWMPDLNRRLPVGSNVTIEMAFNGNGILERISNSTDYYIDIDPDLTDAPLDWKKPLGSGLTIWPNLTAVDRNWTKANLALDSLYSFFSAPGNLTKTTNKFLWCSHTFTHEILNNNSFSDTINEISFNFQLASDKFWGLDGQTFWSNKSMVTPGISGFFNGDALRGLMDFGITGAVGDSSRPKTLNPHRPMWWPLITTVANNGHDGFTIIPRQSVTIYFNTTNTVCSMDQTNHTYEYLMAMEVFRNMRTLALLSWAPAMFHQANLRNADLPVVTMGSATGKLGLMQQWVEAIFGNFTQVSNWPIINLKQDDLTQKFINRQIYETAGVIVNQFLNVTANGVGISGISVTTQKSCVAPVTLPPEIGLADIISLPEDAATEQIGVDAITVWIPLVANASPVHIKFK